MIWSWHIVSVFILLMLSTTLVSAQLYSDSSDSSSSSTSPQSSSCSSDTGLNENGLRSFPDINSPPSMIRPSFGGVVDMKFPDGLTLNGKVYDLSNYTVTIPKNIADVGEKVTIKIKQQVCWGPTYWQHVGVYMFFDGKEPETYNANLILDDDKKDGPSLYDSNGYTKDFKVKTELDNKYTYTTFQFIVAKKMPDTSMIISAWDSYLRTNYVHVHGAIQFGQDPKTEPYEKPGWLQVYANKYDAALAVANSGFKKPAIFSHIGTSEQIWSNSEGGTVLWFCDTKDSSVAIEVFDANRNLIWQQLELLHKEKASPTQGPDASYAGNHQSRWNEAALEQAKKAEEYRIETTLQMYGYPVYWTHTSSP
jgi:hypothetical protein